MQPKPLNGKVAIVTGAGSPIGMGRAMTFALVQAGARVAMLDINEEWLEQSAGEVRAAGGDDCVLDLVCDISDPESVEDAVRKTIAGLGGLHVLINNAGTINLADLAGGNLPKFWEITPETWSRIIAVNSSGSFFMARAAVGHMLDQGWGRIIGVTTSVDTMYRPGFCPYGPSKASHEALVALMSRELDGTGVTANVLVPGGQTDTHIIPDGIPVERATFMRPEVMNGPAVWLASEESDGINGMRLIAHYWDESLPLDQRLDQAASPAAWPQLGMQGIFPGQDL